MKRTRDRYGESSGTESTSASVETLLRELDGGAGSGPSTDVSPARLLDALRTVEGVDEGFRFDETIVKHSLDELLLVLVALRADGTHGKQLMDDLAGTFDADLSPGTVYPRLHDLEESGTIDVHEMVRTKEYTVADETDARDRVRDAMRQHLAIGRVLHHALTDDALFATDAD
ncbi:gas vesicle protein GvpE [Halarchaeum acidiphilum MH1-52-1]|uniref:Gas vesicle protein GvpE n=1 Tax=Halarchaeum acidiphilum MH1-52-1 TaxID=1261545 RepID=U2YGU1_9EURY|nr:helix-turn-helix transcriptional regulator [Halarchaeum acidiphilum]GAD53586.1 gas vesicle protein GvpE [Halarchaeum acidiphilum MH1-52-1]